MKIYQVDAFTESPFGGNPAGVVINAEGLSEKQMLIIAREMNLSETAFVFSGGEGYDYEVRFFTPVEEVDLCGHATIATFSLLKSKGVVGPSVESIIQKTKAGLLEIRFKPDGGILMKQADPKKLDKTFDAYELTDIMGLAKENLGIQIMPQAEIWSTGLEDILLPVKSIEALKTLTIDFAALAILSRKLDVVGVHAFTIDEDGQVWCRNFAPAYDIDEESATGTSNGALGACLKSKNFKNGSSLEFTSHQGDWMGRPSRIDVMVIDGETTEVWVGGKAVTVLEGDILVP